MPEPQQPSGWFVETSPRQGPFTGQQLIAFAKAGKLKSTTPLSHPTQTKGAKVQAGSIRQIQAALKPATPVVAEITDQHPEDAIIDSGKALIAGGATTLGSLASSISSTAASMIPTRSAPPALPSRSSELQQPPVSGLGDFVGDGQDVKMVTKLLGRVRDICVANETPVYAAVQQRPVANFSPDAIVLTNKRFIVFRQKVLGRLTFNDYVWRNVADVHMREDMIGATIIFTAVGNPKPLEVDWLPKAQARKVYRIAQEQEEAAHSHRRELMLEEKRATAAQTVVNTQVQTAPAQAAPAAAVDPVAKLTQLKQMLDAGLIEQSEYDAKKAQVLGEM